MTPAQQPSIVSLVDGPLRGQIVLVAPSCKTEAFPELRKPGTGPGPTHVYVLAKVRTYREQDWRHAQDCPCTRPRPKQSVPGILPWARAVLALVLLAAGAYALAGCASYRQWRYAAGFNGMAETLDEMEKAKKRGRPQEFKQKPFWTGALTALNARIAQWQLEESARNFERALKKWQKTAEESDGKFEAASEAARKETDDGFRLACEAKPGHKWTGSACEDTKK